MPSGNKAGMCLPPAVERRLAHELAAPQRPLPQTDYLPLLADLHLVRLELAGQRHRTVLFASVLLLLSLYAASATLWWRPHASLLTSFRHEACKSTLKSS